MENVNTAKPAASKSDKFNNAVARATGTEPAVAPTAAPIGNTGAMFSTFDPTDLNKLAESGAVEFAPQMMSLEVGQKIEGFLEGMGPGNDFTDEETGKIRHVDSWIIASADGSLRVSILSSSQLDRKVPPFIGGPIGIARNKDIKLAGGHKCADYHVWGPKRADGARRTWAAIPAASETKALPEIAEGAHGSPAVNAEDLV